MSDLDVNVTDQVEEKEDLTNTKKWFNGVHTFSSVKVVTEKEPPKTLEINVADTVSSNSGLA